MRVAGVCKWWDAERGFGVVTSPEVDGEVWVHFSRLERAGYRNLVADEPVEFTYETPGQDGYPHRAVWVRSLRT